MKRLTTVSLVICLAALNADFVRAGVPQTINYRGRLVDASGVPVVDGAQLVSFSIYSSVTGGTALWTSGFHPVTTVGGLFSHVLGSNVALPTGLFSDNPALYLGIQIGVDAEIAPRTGFNSSAFALQAEGASWAETALDAENLGTHAPSYYLDWNNLTGLPAGFADGIDNVGSGDITGVTATGGLIGGGTTGDVTVKIATGGIIGSHIATGAIGTDEVAERSLLGIDIQKNTITRSELAPDLVGPAELASGAVRSIHVLDNSLTADDLAPNSVTNSEIFDGSISNVDISQSAGIATSKIFGTAVNQVSTQNITGQKTFSNLKIAPTTRRVSLTSAAFVSANLLNSAIRFSNGAVRTTGSGGLFYANLSLPDGAMITRLEGLFQDLDAANDASLHLDRVPHASPNTVTNVAGAATSGASPNFQTVFDNSIVNGTVDSQNYRYLIGVNWLNGSSDPGAQIIFYGVTVTYTITRPLP